MPTIVTKSMQDAAQRLHSLLDQHLHSVLQPAIDAETAPLKEEIENHRVLVNETVEKARLDMADAVKALSDKENELVGARSRIVEDENQIGQLNQILAERDAEILSLKTQTKDRGDELTAARAQLASVQARAKQTGDELEAALKREKENIDSLKVIMADSCTKAAKITELESQLQTLALKLTKPMVPTPADAEKTYYAPATFQSEPQKQEPAPRDA